MEHNEPMEHNEHQGHQHDDHNCEGEHVRESVRLEGHMHDGACVVSGQCVLHAEYGKVREKLKVSLEKLAAEVTTRGGVIGHIKAAAEIRSVEMFSVTESDVSVKCGDLQDVVVRFAAIIFYTELEETRKMVDALLLRPLIEAFA